MSRVFSAGDGQVLVRVAAAGINPGEITIRNGAMEQMFPAAFPSGQGSDFAGRFVEVGPKVNQQHGMPHRDLAGPAVPTHQLPGALDGVPDVEQLADQRLDPAGRLRCSEPSHVHPGNAG